MKNGAVLGKSLCDLELKDRVYRAWKEKLK